VSRGHAAAHLKDVDVVVTSSAVRPDNPEVRAARERGVPVIPRAEMLGELMRMKRGIAVAGAHGKTTTTSLVATLLAHAGLDPTMVIGGKLNSLGSNARLGQGEFLVAEADESDGSFLQLSPTYAVITNIDPEHLDHYGTLEAIQEAFVIFANKVPFYGLVVACLDHPNVKAILPRITKRVTTYGLSKAADVRAEEIVFGSQDLSFLALRRGRALGRVQLRMIGMHNVMNSLAVVAVGEELGIPFGTLQEALASFQGVQRRFSLRGEAGGISVVDDYGHHPEEIKATLAGARLAHPGRRTVVVFQPHRYTRTRDLAAAFSEAFSDADCLGLLDIYAASEDPLPGVTGQALADRVRAAGHPGVTFAGTREQAVEWLLSEARPGDLVITLGAGDVWKVGEEFLRRLPGSNGTGSQRT
jgi:UDP-N-acetylmuramate--alanine ligase